MDTYLSVLLRMCSGSRGVALTSSSEDVNSAQWKEVLAELKSGPTKTILALVSAIEMVGSAAFLFSHIFAHEWAIEWLVIGQCHRA